MRINGDTWAMKIPPELGGSYIMDLSQSMAGVDGKKYFDIAPAAAMKGVKLPSRDTMLDELEALGKEFKCGTYREWDSFENLIKALRRGEVLRY